MYAKQITEQLKTMFELCNARNTGLLNRCENDWMKSAAGVGAATSQCMKFKHSPDGMIAPAYCYLCIASLHSSGRFEGDE